MDGPTRPNHALCLHRLAHHAQQIAPLRARFQFTLVDARNIQQIAHQAVESLRVALAAQRQPQHAVQSLAQVERSGAAVALGEGSAPRRVASNCRLA